MYDALTDEERKKIMAEWAPNGESPKPRREIRAEYQIGRITGINIDNRELVASPPLNVTHASCTSITIFNSIIQHLL